MLKPLALTLALIALGLSSAAAAEWSFTDRAGNTAKADAPPQRIVAYATSAAALIPLGIRPVAIFANSKVEDVKALQGLDLTGIEVIGETYAVINLEKLAALKPDLIIVEHYPRGNSYSGGDVLVGEASPAKGIAPLVSVSQGQSILTMIEDYEALAKSLGADLSGAAAEKAKFETALARFKAATAAKPGLTALAVSPEEEAIWVVDAAGVAELSDFASWGLNFIPPTAAEDYWEKLSWENADRYQPDVLLIDDRYGPITLETAQKQPTWTTIRAAAAGAIADWPAFWIRSYAGYAGALDRLAASLEALPAKS